jgi:hypothetical protein
VQRGQRSGDDLPGPVDTLDDAVATYFNEDRPGIVWVDILGPVRVRAPGPIERKRIPLCTELIIYLAVHDNRVHTAAQFDLALWPDRVVQPSTRTEAIARARRWLGTNHRGKLHLPPSHRGELRLGHGVRLDWDLFQRLTARARAGGDRGVEDLATALRLVRGKPFEGIARSRYRWLPETFLEQDICTAVVEAAHAVAHHRLRARDPLGARDAARIAQFVDRYDERPWRDLIAAEHYLGNFNGVRRTVTELINTLEVDSMHELNHETRHLINLIMSRERRQRHLRGNGSGVRSSQ